jgi:hypothetical protein
MDGNRNGEEEWKYCPFTRTSEGCYVSQTKGETNPNNLVISVLDIGKGCYSLP